jgi:hypothetical protein
LKVQGVKLRESEVQGGYFKTAGSSEGSCEVIPFFFWVISLTPSNFSHFCKHPHNIQKLSLTHLELSKILTYPNPYKLGHKFFKKDQNTHVFHLKKIKKIYFGS